MLDDSNDTIFLGIGTLINRLVPSKPKKVVFSTGAGYGKLPRIQENKWKFYCVRGPRTAKALSIDPNLAITDGAALVATVDTLPTPKKRFSFGYMPHHLSLIKGPWHEIAKAANLKYVDATNDVDTVLREIASCEILITEAMHGAIVADALRIPWIPVRCYRGILEFKWNDWCESLGIQYVPITIPALWQIPPHVICNKFWPGKFCWRSNRRKREMILESFDRIKLNARAFLSEDAVFAEALERLQSSLALLKKNS